MRGFSMQQLTFLAKLLFVALWGWVQDGQCSNLNAR